MVDVATRIRGVRPCGGGLQNPANLKTSWQVNDSGNDSVMRLVVPQRPEFILVQRVRLIEWHGIRDVVDRPAARQRVRPLKLRAAGEPPLQSYLQPVVRSPPDRSHVTEIPQVWI